MSSGSGQVPAPIHRLSTSRRPVFLLNSRQRLFVAALAPLLPKLRGHFAEFLGEGYLAPLSILYLSPVSVWYGSLFALQCGSFLGAFPFSRCAKSGTGMLARAPSVMPFGFALGPDSPSADEPCGGILRLSGYRILPGIFATQANIFTPTLEAYDEPLGPQRTPQHAPLSLHFGS